ncbi:sugar transferase [Luteipulveratus halotolerans]|uniref:sugar transferase n=1 Tax=Luteipulveratus halotolerans TaxID=1631356 RepID=UPI0009E41957|nr:sugar transferase [Luteipulveratus halotolerans]
MTDIIQAPQQVSDAELAQAWASTGSPARPRRAQRDDVAAAPRSRRHQRRATWLPQYVRRALALDAFAGLAATLVALAMVRVSDSARVGPVVATLALVVVPAAWLAAMAQARGYERRLLGVGAEELRAVPRAVVRLLAVTAVVTLAVGDPVTDLARVLVLVFVPVVLVLSLTLRYLLRQGLHRRRHRGSAMQRAVVVGCGEAAGELIADLRRDASQGLRPVAACTTATEPVAEGLARHAGVSDTLRIVDETFADVVVIAHPSALTPPELRRLSWALESRQVELMISPGIMEVAGPRLSFRPSATLSLVHVEQPAADGGALLGKALFDRSLALMLLVIASPVLALTALAIKIDSRGPVLFRQVRVGAHGKSFKILKLRSMVVEAEDRLEAVRAEADHGNGRLYKRHDDPRVTNVGRVIRRFSIDELPQLVNVVRGDMSLVGPRPPLHDEVAQYEDDAIRRLRVRPGLTGLWQVSGRSNLSWDESLRLDLRYVDNWSMMLDLQILWRTGRAVLRGEGAY